MGLHFNHLSHLQKKTKSITRYFKLDVFVQGNANIESTSKFNFHLLGKIKIIQTKRIKGYKNPLSSNSKTKIKYPHVPSYGEKQD